MSNASTTANAAISILGSEAFIALEEAKKLKAQLEALPPDDPTRPILQKQIEDLVQRSLRYSNIVTSTASST